MEISRTKILRNTFKNKGMMKNHEYSGSMMFHHGDNINIIEKGMRTNVLNSAWACNEPVYCHVGYSMNEIRSQRYESYIRTYEIMTWGNYV